MVVVGILAAVFLLLASLIPEGIESRLLEISAGFKHPLCKFINLGGGIAHRCLHLATPLISNSHILNVIMLAKSETVSLAVSKTLHPNKFITNPPVTINQTSQLIKINLSLPLPFPLPSSLPLSLLLMYQNDNSQ